MDVIVNGLHVKGTDSGRGPVALLLHGWGGDHKTIVDLKSALPGHRIIAPDLPGFGGSQPPGEAWGIERYGEFIIDLLHKLNVKQTDILVGHSFGGRIALDLVGNGRATPNQLILLASHGLQERRTLGSRLLGLAANLSHVLPAAWRTAVGRRFRSEDYQATTGVMSQVFLNVIAQDATQAASRIQTKTLLIYGLDDKTTPPDMGRRFNRLIVGSRLELVEGAGHYVHLDQPERVAKLIKEFIK